MNLLGRLPARDLPPEAVIMTIDDMGGCQNYGTHWGTIKVILGLYGGIMEKKMEITIVGYKGGCQNYGPFLGTLNIRCRIIIGYPKRDHNFDNHPYQ